MFPLAVRFDGKILVRIREQLSLYEASVTGLARLNPDGSLDVRYHLPRAAFGNDYLIIAGAFEQDGSALLAVNLGNGTTEPGLIRLFPEGTVPGFQVAIDQVRVEENAGSVTVVIERTGNTTAAADVNIATLNGSAQGGSDFVAPSNSVHFDPLETTKTLTISILDDQLVGANTDFKIKLTSASPGVLLGSGLTTTTITIADNEHAGHVDPNFRPAIYFPSNGGNGVSSPVVALQADGRILVAGSLTVTNPVTGLPTSIVRLNPDGSLDPSLQLTIPFSPGFFIDPFGSSVYSLALQSNQDILIGGTGSLTMNDQPAAFLARVHPDGATDTGFAPDPKTISNPVHLISVQSDGKILVDQVIAGTSGTQQSTLVRLNSDGSLDPSWNMGSVSNGVWNTAIYSAVPLLDGRVLIAGDFSGIQNVTRNAIARLNSDGSLDQTFNPGSGGHGSITALAVQLDEGSSSPAIWTLLTALSSPGLRA
jgi:uncharacterized delta-60 repeat protein